MVRSELFPPTWPTDRVGQSPDLGVGIDTVGLRGPVSASFMDTLPHIRMRQIFDSNDLIDCRLVGGSVHLPVFAGSAFVTADLRCGMPEVRVEFSAPSILHGHNRDVLPTDLLSDVVEVTLAALDRELPGMPTLDEIRVTRLDLTRDLDGVAETGDTLTQLSRLSPSRWSIHSSHMRDDGHVQSLVRGRRDRWRSTTYDKGYELAQKAGKTPDPAYRELLRSWSDASTSRLRFESRLYSTLLKEKRMHSLDNINGAELTRVAASHFEAANVGALLSGGSRMRDLLTHLKPSERRRVLAYLAAELLDVDIELSHNPRDEVRATCRRLNLTPDDLIASGDEPRRLDIDAGRELRGDDAIQGLIRPGSLSR